jgi:hypothetical protein
MPLNSVGEQLDPDNLPEGVQMPGLGKYGPGIEDVGEEETELYDPSAQTDYVGPDPRSSVTATGAAPYVKES